MLNNGDIVKSHISAQGLMRGRCYEVIETRPLRGALGWCTQYDLMDDELQMVRGVRNGHLVLEKVLDASDDGVGVED